MSDRIVLAKIAGAHGIKGLVKIFPFGEDPTLLETAPCVYGDDRTFKISLKNAMGKFILAEIDGVQSREDAEAIKGIELAIDKSALPAIEEDDSFYYHDLIGLDALSEDEQKIGTVIAVDNFGAGDLLEIQKISGEKFLLPFRDEYVPSVNLKEGHLIIIPMEEMP